MIRASHVIFTAYGFWLPNDPRGSWSDFVRKWELLRFGPATKTNIRRSVAGATHDRAQRSQAKEQLKFPPVHFTGKQALSIANGFRWAVEQSHYSVYACAILPDHVHMVIARHDYHVEQIVRRLKQAATMRLKSDGLSPHAGSPWARNGWKVFLNTDADIRRAIHYVNDNPAKEHKPPQQWAFVTPYTAI
ncbi:hypothetical protein HED60_05295 [Planctomycetales bacterium ZRK34]|nr:hypothetical protein HED60_05295 [Planctomycetales bacterium ZRK34]